MTCLGYLFCVFATITFNDAVKVNIHGSLSIGREVADALKHYLSKGTINGRRSMSVNVDTIATEVNSAVLCRKIDICKGPVRTFIKDYVAALAETIENVFSAVVNEEVAKKLDNAKPIFGKLKGVLGDVKKVLKTSNEKATDSNEGYIWVGIVKKISGKFLTRAVTYVIDRLDSSVADVKKRLIQSIVITIIETEAEYQKSLCYEYDICLQPVECTKALNNVLELLKNLSDTKVKVFMKAFFELLPDTKFYSYLSEVTNNEFQVILNDMAFANNVPTKEILAAVQKTVQTRLDTPFVKGNGSAQGVDVVLIHRILSDMDMFYSKRKSDPFHTFLDDFVNWTKNERKLSTCMKRVMKDIQDVLSGISEELSTKLTYEVRVFLELTVDPDTVKNNDD